MTESELPYGLGELDPDVEMHPARPNTVRCYVRGCSHFVHRQTKRWEGVACPEHGIYCHYSNRTPTYSYKDVKRNIIASPELFAQRVVDHPFKYESNRLVNEKSEDALSWNVFRSVRESGHLAGLAEMLIGESADASPRLYLWGLRIDDDSFAPWDLLEAARARFENNLPVVRPLTEPDIALHLPGRYLLLIEAKFTSGHTWYERGPRKDNQSLTLDELLDIYWDDRTRLLNRDEARNRNRVHYQLWRNMVFAEWMAIQDSPQTRAYHVNLVRRGYEEDAALEFAELVEPRWETRFQHKTWQGIYDWLPDSPTNQRLQTYLECKSANLVAAFDLAKRH